MTVLSPSRPVRVGALAGLAVGLVGLFAVSPGRVSFGGAMLGAVAGGATAAYLTDEGLRTDVRSACLADLLSSLLFFCLVLVGYLALVALAEGLALVSAVGFSFVYLLFGGAVAIPIALVSLCLAAVSGAVTSLVTPRSNPGAAPDSSRE